jgi:arylformamidase
MCLDHPAVVAGLAISGIFELGPIRDTELNDKLRLSDEEIATLSPMRLPVIHKNLAITYGTDELPPLVSDSRDLNAKRAAEHAPGVLVPVAGANHFTIMHELRDVDGLLTRQVMLLA